MSKDSFNKRPAFQFYPGDWLRDTALRTCSVSARGLWIEMICLMHEGTPYGRLKVNNKVIQGETLGRIVGANIGEVEKWLKELEDAGVFSREEDGTIYSRRMVKDEKLRQIRSSCGKNGGNPELIGEYNSPGFIYIAERKFNKNLKIGISSNPSKRIYKIRQQFKGESIELIDKVYVSDMGNIENQLHKIFKNKASGEWFDLDDSERNYLFSLISHLKENIKENLKENIKENLKENIKENLKENPTPAFAFASSLKDNTNTNTNTPLTPQVGNEESVKKLVSSSDKKKISARGISKRHNSAMIKTMQEKFEKFWSAYPRKVSKGQAEKAFIAIDPDEQLLASMIATIERAKKSEQWTKDNGQYIPYPATWLWAKGWLDNFEIDIDLKAQKKANEQSFVERVRKLAIERGIDPDYDPALDRGRKP